MCNIEEVLSHLTQIFYLVLFYVFLILFDHFSKFFVFFSFLYNTWFKMNFFSFQPREPLQSHIQNGLGLNIWKLKLWDQSPLGFFAIRRRSDQLNDFIQKIKGFDEPFQNMRARKRNAPWVPESFIVVFPIRNLNIYNNKILLFQHI